MCLHKDLHISIHASFTCNRPKLETTQTSFRNKWINTLAHIHGMELYSAATESQLFIDTALPTELKTIMPVKEAKQQKKVHMA